MQPKIARISVLASKMCQIKKVKAYYHPKLLLFIIWYKKLPLFFLFDPFQRIGQKSWQYFVAFLENLRQLKFVLRLTDLYLLLYVAYLRILCTFRPKLHSEFTTLNNKNYKIYVKKITFKVQMISSINLPQLHVHQIPFKNFLATGPSNPGLIEW